MILFVSLLRQDASFIQVMLISSANVTDCHNIFWYIVKCGAKHLITPPYPKIWLLYKWYWLDCQGCNRLVVAFTSANAIDTYRHLFFKCTKLVYFRRSNKPVHTNCSTSLYRRQRETERQCSIYIKIRGQMYGNSTQSRILST